MCKVLTYVLRHFIYSGFHHEWWSTENLKASSLCHLRMLLKSLLLT